MQSLLSKAVEEQAAEQRAVSTALAQIRERVTALSEEVAALSGLGDAVGEVDADVRRSTTLLADRLNALAAEVTGGAGRDVAGLRAELAQISGKPDAPSADEVAARVQAELSVGVVAPVVEQVSSTLTGVVDPVVTQVVDAVERLVAASEARVLAYVDSAVVALAEALLLARPAAAPAPAPTPESLAPARRALRTAEDEPAPAPSPEAETAPADEETVTALRPADTRRGRWRTTSE